MEDCEKLYNSLKWRYKVRLINTFPVDYSAHPWGVGVVLDWPRKDGEALEKQEEKIKKIAARFADKRNLEAVIEGPTFASGGARVLYIGLKDK